MYAARVSINVVRLILTLMYWNETNCRVNQHMSHVAVVSPRRVYSNISGPWSLYRCPQLVILLVFFLLFYAA